MSEVFDNLVKEVRIRKGLPPAKEMAVLAFDPGETTGYSLWVVNGRGEAALTELGQLDTWPIERALPSISRVLHSSVHTGIPLRVVYERYNVYGQKRNQHVGSDVPTLRVIGLIETLCLMQETPFDSSQNAAMAKGFCTDPNLHRWGFYAQTIGQRHARDAVRHGAYYILFGHHDGRTPK